MDHKKQKPCDYEFPGLGSCTYLRTKVICRQGNTGPTGPAGPRGFPGSAGPPGGALIFADFFALMPPDNAATVAPGSDVNFPQDGPTSGGTDIIRTGPEKNVCLYL